MSMKMIVQEHPEEGYIETRYVCASCGAEIGKFREHRGERMCINWELFNKCSCGATLVREVMQVVPDISECVVVEVGGKEE